jgi:hypothetical protein
LTPSSGGTGLEEAVVANLSTLGRENEKDACDAMTSAHCRKTEATTVDGSMKGNSTVMCAATRRLAAGS